MKELNSCLVFRSFKIAFALFRCRSSPLYRYCDLKCRNIESSMTNIKEMVQKCSSTGVNGCSCQK